MIIYPPHTYTYVRDQATIKDPYRFYVYAWIRSKDSKTAKAGTPYYIGKGSHDRAWSKAHSSSRPKDRCYIVILESNLSELGALAFERRYIEWFGRVDLGTGILRNLSEGGEGLSNVSEKTREKQSKSAIKRCEKPEEIKRRSDFGKTRTGSKNPFFGKTHSEKTIKLIKEANDRRPPDSEETRKRKARPGDLNGMFGKKGDLNPKHGNQWYNNGIENRMFKEHPGEGWVKDRIKQEKKYYNNGIENRMFLTPPDDTWKIGKIPDDRPWWNNGKSNKKSDECPGEGWTRGRYRGPNKKKD